MPNWKMMALVLAGELADQDEAPCDAHSQDTCLLSKDGTFSVDCDDDHLTACWLKWAEKRVNDR